jgi:flagellar biogenesis protein FliO
MTPLGRYVLETVATLFLVAALAVVVLYAVRRLGVGRPTGPLQLAGRLTLDARKAIYLVRIGETVYVIGASEAGLAKLGEVPRSEIDVALEDMQPPLITQTSGFRDLLKGLRRDVAQRPDSERAAGARPGEPIAPSRTEDT